MYPKIYAFDPEEERCESLHLALSGKYDFIRVSDPTAPLSEGENIAAIILDPELGKRISEKIAEFAFGNLIPLFVWVPIGQPAPKFQAKGPVFLLPTPSDPEEVVVKLQKVIEAEDFAKIIIATLDDDLVASVEPYLLSMGMDVVICYDYDDLKKELEIGDVSLILCDVSLAENILEKPDFSPRTPVIVYINPAFQHRPPVNLDKMSLLVPSSLTGSNLAQLIKNSLDRAEQEVNREKGFLKALEEAERNRRVANRLTELLISTSTEKTTDKRGEDLNLLNAQTLGLVGELFDNLGIVIEGTRLLIGAAAAPELSADLFKLGDRLKRAEEILEALCSVVWFKEGGPSEPLSLEKVVTNALGKVKSNRRRKDIDWRVELSGLGVTVGNQQELTECFIALITNAYEALGETGTIEITSSSEKGYDIINISDDGCGMSKETLENAAKPYWTTKTAAHIGLGLTIAKGIIDFHNGTLEISSTQGKGTTITIKLPRSTTSLDKELEPRKPDLLLVSHRRSLGFLQASLVKYGWSVVTVETIGDAVQKARKLEPKMILISAAIGYIDVDAIRIIVKAKGDSKLVLLDPNERIPPGIKGLDATIRGSIPLHHILSIIHAYLEE